MTRGPDAAARRTARRALDRRFVELWPLAAQAVPPRGGWIRAIREALGMSQADLGVRMGTAPTSVRQLESNERDGRARLDTLRRAADALGCDLVYALIPRQPLETVVDNRAAHQAAVLLGRVDHSMRLEAQQVLPAAARDHLVEQAARLVDQPGLWRDS